MEPQKPPSEMTQYELARELARLSSILTTKANTCEAKAQEHAKLKELPEWEKEMGRLRSGRHFAAVAHYAAEKMEAKGRKAGAFEKPTWEAVAEYAKTALPAWPMDDVESWFNHFQTCGWVIGKDKPMKDWHSAAKNGFRNWQKRNPVGAVAKAVAKKNDDPEGWYDWLVKTMKRKYQPYRYEMPFLQEAFRKRVK